MKEVDNDYFIGSEDFIIPEAAMFSLYHSMFFFLEIYFETPNVKTTLRASTHYAFFGRSLVFSCFLVLLVVHYSRINFFLF